MFEEGVISPDKFCLKMLDAVCRRSTCWLLAEYVQDLLTRLWPAKRNQTPPLPHRQRGPFRCWLLMGHQELQRSGVSGP